MNRDHEEVVIIGGGVGGLASAALAARAGKRTLLLEGGRALGGRAATADRNGFLLNLGPHALYRAGALRRLAMELGVELSGQVPKTAGAFAIRDGWLHTLPLGFLSLVSTGLLPLKEKVALAKILSRLPKLDAKPLEGVSVNDWLEELTPSPRVREFLEATVRVTTYANAPDLLDAGATLAQIQLGLKANVLYLDGGWKTLVAGLRAAATLAGARIRESAPVRRVTREGDTFSIALDGEIIESRDVIIAASPKAAATLVAPELSPSLRRWEREAVPVRATTLDVALRQSPSPKRSFALGMDEPLYLSLHSRYARLAPDGGGILHAAWYLRPDDSTEGAKRRERLEWLIEAAQPGWREQVVHEQFLPRITVSHGMPLASAGGLRGRPGPEVPDCPGLYVVGDWVGPEGMLADASAASARLAVEAIVERSKASELREAA